jgi:hypothetical protein
MTETWPGPSKYWHRPKLFRNPVKGCVILTMHSTKEFLFADYRVQFSDQLDEDSRVCAVPILGRTFSGDAMQPFFDACDAIQALLERLVGRPIANDETAITVTHPSMPIMYQWDSATRQVLRTFKAKR